MVFAGENTCKGEKDSDFLHLSNLQGCPPKVIHLICGNKTTLFINNLLVANYNNIINFSMSTDCYMDIIYNKLANPTITHRKDQYKLNNDGHYHFFVVVNYRISYYENLNENEIVIVRFRHEKMEFQNY